MQRIGTDGGVFIDGNPATGTQGTVVTGAWLNSLQEELAAIVEDLGGTLSAADNGQVIAALLNKFVLKTLLATATAAGIVELATAAEVQAGTDATRAVTTAGLVSRTATDIRTGIVELATAAEVQTGTDTTRVVTPAGLAPLRSIGVAQTWQDVASNRSVSTVYTNTTGRPIGVCVVHNIDTGHIELFVGGLPLARAGVSLDSHLITVFGIVAPGSTYEIQVAGSLGVYSWKELR